jgi:hypothetical protein
LLEDVTYLLVAVEVVLIVTKVIHVHQLTLDLVLDDHKDVVLFPGSLCLPFYEMVPEGQS